MKSILVSLALCMAVGSAQEARSGSLHHLVARAVLDSQTRGEFRQAMEDRPASYRGGRIDCTFGTVIVDSNDEVYSCKGIDLLSFISSEELQIPGDQFLNQSSDIWGWTSPEGKELTLLTLDTGLVIIDSTDPEDPCIIAKSRSQRPASPWGDVKVVNNHAYTIKDEAVAVDSAPEIGMEIYELTQFAAMDCKSPDYVVPLVDAGFVTNFHGLCHNVISNTETDRVYAVGCRDTCEGGLIILDVSENPLEPTMIGCVDEDGYTHDAQCVVYDGPDEEFVGKEICFAFNEETLAIIDVTDASNPIFLSNIFYENQAYSHQGWLTKDMSKILLDDELDELCNANVDDVNDTLGCGDLVKGTLSGKVTTTTNVFDITSLRNPVIESVFDFQTQSIDHNLYEWGTIHRKGWSGSGAQDTYPDDNFAYMHNYMSGLRVVDVSDPDSNNWVEKKFFDINQETELEFFGAWSGYMFPSGHYALSSIEKGIFFLDTNTPFLGVTEAPTVTPEEDDSNEPFIITALTVAIIGIVVGLVYVSYKRPGVMKEKIVSYNSAPEDDEEAKKESAHSK